MLCDVGAKRETKETKEREKSKETKQRGRPIVSRVEYEGFLKLANSIMLKKRKNEKEWEKKR